MRVLNFSILEMDLWRDGWKIACALTSAKKEGKKPELVFLSQIGVAMHSFNFDEPHNLYYCQSL